MRVTFPTITQGVNGRKSNSDWLAHNNTHCNLL
jgi:hypothetical protein